MKFNWQNGSFDGIKEIADILRKEGAVAVVPTETVYGLVGRAADPACREKIYQLKHRDPAKHLGLFAADFEQLEKAGIRLEGVAKELAAQFMPGPLTLIVRKADDTTVGFRIPAHPQLQALLKEVGEVLFQTSANRSGFPNALSCTEAVNALCGEADAAADGGDIPADALASTIVDCTGDVPVIIRQGGLKIDDFIQKFR